MSIPGNPVETIGEILRQAALQQARQFTGSGSLQVLEVHDGFELGQVLSRRMALIVISGADISILFKVHFKSGEGGLLRRSRHTDPAAEPAPTVAETTDYMKELTNLICGQVCRSFQLNNHTLGMCIPLVMRGFYELYADYTPSEKPLTKFGTSWQVVGDFGTLACTAYVEIADMKVFDGLQLLDDSPVNDDDEMEFL